MKKIRLLAVQSQKEQLLRELMLFGCVEISEPDFDANENSLLTRVAPSETPERFKQKMDKLTDAVKLMDQYAPAKKGLLSAKPEVQWSRLENDAKVEECQRKASELLFIDERLKGALNEEQNCLGTIESLRPWEIMEMPLETTQTRSCSVLTGTVSAKQELGEVRDAFNAADLAVELQCVSADEDAQYILCIFLKSEADAVMSVLRNYSFSAITFGGLKGTARDNIRRLEEQVEALQPRKQAFVEEIAAYAADREDFQCCIDYLGTKMERAQASYKLLGTDSTVYLQGWLSAPDEDELRTILEKYDCAWELIEPEESEYPDVPVKLKNNWFTRPLNMVTEMYSLPAYDGLDPNPLMAPFFILFYGIMMADMGYGLVMLLLGWLIKKKMRPAAGTTMNHMGGLMLECGVTTFLFGALTGGFFGDFIPQIVKMCGGPTFELPYLFTPLNDTLSILIGALALGVVQTITGMAISV
ncbi:MAG: V-type ATP synthase subunit I, partial [Oscillospiraceae bacterium]|nr:V-type ATP synthase subunit I [Oscillospiraceae bacterium]